MSSIKDPTQKKAKSLKKDHRTFAWESTKGLRVSLRKKKRVAAKKERRATDSALRDVSVQDCEGMDSPQRQVPRRVYKTSTVKLADAIEIKKDRRKRFGSFSYNKPG